MGDAVKQEMRDAARAIVHGCLAGAFWAAFVVWYWAVVWTLLITLVGLVVGLADAALSLPRILLRFWGVQ